MLTCPVCKCKFPIHYIRAGKPQKYCSKKCRYVGEKTKHTCKTCGKVFVRSFLGTKASHIYCSLACIQRSPCQFCGKTITGRSRFQSGVRRFCSRKCASVAHQVIGSKTAYKIKAFFQSLKKNGKIACNRCGTSDHRVLVVHHPSGRKNGHRKLELLCANCHHLVHWSKSQKHERDVEAARYIYAVKPNANLFSVA